MNKAGQPSQKHKLGVNAAVAIALVCLLSVTLFLFSRSYKSLREAIQQERTDYVSEISNQLITGHLLMQDEYSRSVQRIAGIVDRSRARSMDDVAACFTPDDWHSIMLISEAGEIVDLSGKHYFSTDRQIVERLCQNNGVTQFFASLNNENEYWLFACAIDDLNINEDCYSTVMMAVPADRYSTALAISLFGNRGASYVINKGGVIEIAPNDANTVFGGYNLFSSLKQTGVSQTQLDELTSAIENELTGCMLLDIQGQDWLFGYSGMGDDNAIVVAVPLTLTAAKTYDGLSNTLLFMSLAIAVVALGALCVMLRFFYRDRERTRKAIAIEARSGFFSKMSHDIRTPLNAVIGLQELIRDSGDIDVIKEYNDQSNVASTYLLSILNDVLDISRIENGKIQLAHEPFDMNELLRDAGVIMAGMAEKKNVLLTTQADARFENYYIGDAVRVRQVILNLLSNAVKFTRPDGKVALSMSHKPVDDVYDEVTLKVSDTGIGMSAEYLPKAFDPFEQEYSSYTQSYAGSGLGLAIVNSLVAQMRGKIDVKSELDKGSEFTVTLPLERGERIPIASPAQVKKSGRSACYAGTRVLLAEDNSINQLIVQKLLLSKFSIDVEVAPDGEQAVEMFSGSMPGYYSLILMDIKMPVMDGLQAAAAIRALPRSDAKTIPIIALSANAYQEDVALSIQSGMNEHLSKPIDISALTDALDKFLNHQEVS